MEVEAVVERADERDQRGGGEDPGPRLRCAAARSRRRRRRRRRSRGRRAAASRGRRARARAAGRSRRRGARAASSAASAARRPPPPRGTRRARRAQWASSARRKHRRRGRRAARRRRPARPRATPALTATGAPARAPRRRRRAPRPPTYGAVVAAGDLRSRSRPIATGAPTGASVVGAGSGEHLPGGDRRSRRSSSRRRSSSSRAGARGSRRRPAASPAAPSTGSGRRGRTRRAPAASSWKVSAAGGRELGDEADLAPADQLVAVGELLDVALARREHGLLGVDVLVQQRRGVRLRGRARRRSRASCVADRRRVLVVEDLDRPVGQPRRVVLPGEAHARPERERAVAAAERPEHLAVACGRSGRRPRCCAS